jgi:hypothetical protein
MMNIGFHCYAIYFVYYWYNAITGISLLEPGTSLNMRMSRSQRCLLLACLDHKDVCYLYYAMISYSLVELILIYF